MDEEQHILKNRKVKLEIYGEGGMISARKISRALTKSSDNNGIAIFDNLLIDVTGTFKILLYVRNNKFLQEFRNNYLWKLNNTLKNEK